MTSPGTSKMPPRDQVMAFVDDLSVPVLADRDRHHLQRSLRLRPGAQLSVGDGRGAWRSVRFGDDLSVESDVVMAPASVPKAIVGFAPVKGDRSELIVQKLTELGASTIVALRTDRSVVRWDEARSAKNIERFGRIAREAAMQSRNPWLPNIEAQVGLDDFVNRWPGAWLADPGASRELTAAFGDSPGDQRDQIAVAIGPEGGFDQAELAGRDTVRLPGRILRTETAAITVGVLLATRRG